jgi:hypothetical protein
MFERNRYEEEMKKMMDKAPGPPSVEGGGKDAKPSQGQSNNNKNNNQKKKHNSSTTPSYHQISLELSEQLMSCHAESLSRAEVSPGSRFDIHTFS